MQMAASDVGSLTLPPLFGLLAERVGFWLFPVALLVLSVVVLAAFLGLMALKGWRPRRPGDGRA